MEGGENAYGAALVLTVVLLAGAGAAEAIRFYKRYLADAPAAANRPVAEKHIRDLESALGAEELTGAHVAPGPGAPGAEPSGMPAARPAHARGHRVRLRHR
jgi:hypothetical protein